MSRKKALITGASRGIGRGIAIKLAEDGYDVGINYLDDKDEAEQVCNEAKKFGGKTLAIQGDVRHVHDIEAMFSVFLEEFGGIDLLVNNAGITRFKPFLEVTEEMWEETTRTDWKGAYFCSQQAARSMVERKEGGVIINITSIHTDIQFPHASVYGPSKAALEKFTRHAALELAHLGIRVNAVAPGSIKNDPLPGFTPRQEMFISKTPLQRMGYNEEVADAVLFLSSNKASYITGTTLLVDGGAALPALLDNTYITNREGN